MLRGGELGPAISRKEPDQSLLLQAIRFEELEMPPEWQTAGERGRNPDALGQGRRNVVAKPARDEQAGRRTSPAVRGARPLDHGGGSPGMVTSACRSSVRSDSETTGLVSQPDRRISLGPAGEGRFEAGA